MRTSLRNLLFALPAALFALEVHALPALQIGPGPEAGWSPIGGSDPGWVLAGTGGTLETFARSNAWKNDATSQWAYLVISASPGFMNDADPFDVTVLNDGNILSPHSSGTGNPGLPDHGVFPTYYEIYEFIFDGDVINISNVEDGQDGSGQGFGETFGITLNSMLDEVDGIHFDLFTVKSAGGRYVLGDLNLNKKAPFSHDAEFMGDIPPPEVPEPAALLLLALGILGLGLTARSRTQASAV